ncbi:MAG: hypothetical protein HC780_25060 [Leptolyngbyaceae cyanobacterium CSU_1_3]|nr:hypothetical protein [Leptolyngbyaceae cyanobacterium CSU_1_3]
MLNLTFRSRHPLGSLRRSLLIGLSPLAISLTATIAAAAPTSEISPRPQAASEIGFEFPGSRELNQAAVTEVEYDGECPGKESPTTEAKFSSTKTPPAAGRRVTVRNVTRGVTSDPYPYTNREYHQGRSSESTRIALGAKHDGKQLRVLEGENQFEYEIKQGDRVIDSGTFTAMFEKIVDVQRRDAVASRESICMNSAVALNVCADIRARTEYKCPRGRVIRSLLEPADRGITTLIANQTFKSIVYKLNGEIRRLSPGDSATYTGNSLNLNFNPTCTTCEPTRSLSLQPGKRYQFRASQFNSNLTELTDFLR